MFYSLRSAVIWFWDSWSGIFAPLPYGDPYISVIVACTLFAIGAKLLMTAHD